VCSIVLALLSPFLSVVCSRNPFLGLAFLGCGTLFVAHCLLRALAFLRPWKKQNNKKNEWRKNKYAYNSYSCWVKGGRLDPGRYGVQVAYSIVLALPTLMLVCSALLVITSRMEEMTERWRLTKAHGGALFGGRSPQSLGFCFDCFFWR